MSLAVQFQAEPIRELAFGSISNAYAGIGTAIENPARLIKIDNLTDVTLFISLNGVDDHFVVPSGGFFLFDVASNATNTQGWFVPEGTRFYAKDLGVAASTGSVYLTVCYGADIY